MARGGYRPGAGRPKKSGGASKAGVIAEAKREARKSGVTPLEYMLAVMNDAEGDPDRRDKMAIAAAPYVHVKADTAAVGKKAQRQANAEKAAAGGRFAAPSAPKLVVSNK